MKSLIIGYGSIGRRHESILRQMGCKTAVVSQHANELPCPSFNSLDEAMSTFCPGYVVVSNRTSEHLDTLQQLIDATFKGICFVEKPLSKDPVTQINRYTFDIYVGYVLRFHPLVQKTWAILQGKRLISIHAYVGQYLPDWRPGTDYRQCYSARKEQGGGVIRDLSHELDYIHLLAGSWKRVSAIGGHLSELDIETDDAYGLLMETKHCPLVTCQMNYLDRNVRRDCIIQYEGGTVHINFIKNQLIHNNEIQQFELERNDLFMEMHTAAQASDRKWLCSFADAAVTLELIEASEESSRGNKWVYNKNR